MKTKNIARINIEHSSYPKLLREIKNPPKALFIKGKIEVLSKPAIAIVGTRKATETGKKISEDIAYGLGIKGFSIVSGLAMGIDTAAHIGALKAKAPVIAVLGNGLDRIYPASNTNLANKVLESGGVIASEYESGAAIYKSNFLQRNRIVSGISLAIVVIEMPLHSGALNTANWAADQGRSVFVVPGPINHPNYAGSHKLIRDGGTLVASVEDILEDLGLSAPQTLPKETATEFADESLEIVFDAVKESVSPISADEIIDATGLDAETVNINLATLLIQKLIRENANGYTV